MHSIPTAYQDAWDRAVNDLEPFTFHVMVFRGTDYDPALEDQNGQYSGTPFYMLLAGDFVSCISTKTLYETMTFGECASSELNAQLLTRLSSISYTGRKWTNPTLYTPAIDDQWVVQITPLSLTIGGNGATSPFWVTHGVYYVSDLQTDTTTGITGVKAVDTMSMYGEEKIYWPNGPGAITQAPVTNFLTLALQSLGIAWVSTNTREDGRENNNGHPREMDNTATNAWYPYFVDAFTARELVSVIASRYWSNATVTDKNVLKILFFNYPATAPIRIGYKAERISIDGIYEKFHVSVDEPSSRSNAWEPPTLPTQIQQNPHSDHWTSYLARDLPTTEAYKGSWANHRSEPSAVGGVGWAELKAESFYQYASGYCYSLNDNNQNGKYYAFTATNIVADPALELGDTVSLLNKGDGSGCLADEFLTTLIFPDGIRIKLDLPHDDQTWWEKQTEETQVVGIISKLIIDYRMPQIAQTLQSAANR